jgi:hypothetical protein
VLAKIPAFAGMTMVGMLSRGITFLDEN